MNQANSLYLFLLVLGLVVLLVCWQQKSSEGYYLRDLPFDWGYGGWPPNLYGYSSYGYGPRGVLPVHRTKFWYGTPAWYRNYHRGKGYFRGLGLRW